MNEWDAVRQVRTCAPAVVIRWPFRVAVQAAINVYARTGLMLDAALAYAEHGYPIFPLTHQKKPIPRRDKDSEGKPIPGTGGFKKATTDPLIIRQWWPKKEQNLIGMPMGAPCNLWVLDIDTAEEHADGMTAWSALIEEHGAVATREHRTSSHGLHLIFEWRVEQAIRCARGSLPDGIEVKGQGGYIVVPPSRRKGRAYHVGVDIDPNWAPTWLIELIGAQEPRGHSSNKASRKRADSAKQKQTCSTESTGADPAEFALIADAMKCIPNPNLPWDIWTKFALAIWAATNGQGFAIFDEWSRKSHKYDTRTTQERWQEITGSPPDRIGADYIFKQARAHSWTPKAPPTYPAPHFSDLDAARAEIRRVVREFLKLDEQANNAFQLYANTRGVKPKPPAWGVAVDTGLGKTRIATEEIARSGKDGVIYAVPTHKLGREIEQLFRHHGFNARVFYGRTANDPERPGDKMCLNLRAAALALKLRADISETCCEHKGRYCRFFARCGYQRQQRGAPPAAWIVASDLLFHRHSVFAKPSLLIIDEAVWQKSLRGIEHVVEVPLATLGNGNKRRADIVYQLLMQSESGGLQRRYTEDLTVGSLSGMIKAEWDAMPKIRLRPGMSASQVAQLEQDVRTMNEVAQARLFIDILGELRWVVVNPQIQISGRILLDYTGVPVLRWRSVANITEQFRIPTLLLDATLPSASILQVLHPQAEVVSQVSVALPTCVQIRQVLGAPTSSRKLITNSHLKHQERHLHGVRRYILKRWLELGKLSTLIICQQEVEDWLTGKLPDAISLAHYNAIAGLDQFKDVRLLILVGRTQPGPEAVEAIAGALSASEAKKVEADPQTGFSWYDRVPRGIRLRDGTGVAVIGDQHPDSFAESVRLQITEAELVQAFGRARAVNRTEQTPLDVDFLFDTCLPVTVDEVNNWTAPSLLIETAGEGVMLTSPVDMVRIWPDLWSNAKAAKRTLATGVPNLPGFQRFTYQPRGPKLKTRVAYFDLTVLNDPRGWLEQRLGPLRDLSP